MNLLGRTLCYNMTHNGTYGHATEREHGRRA